MQLVGDKGSEDDEASHLPCFHGQRVDTLQSLHHNRPLKTTFAKMFNNIAQSRLVNSGWQISALVKPWPSFSHPNVKLSGWATITEKL
jgi:hypothetical protein